MIAKRWGVAGIALALAVASCGSSGHRSSTSPGPTAGTTTATSGPGPTTTSPPATTTGPSSSSSAPPSTPTTAPAGPPRCPTSSLSASLTGDNGTAGSVYYSLELTDTGSGSCILQGYAGVSFVTGSNGQQVGAPAQRMTGSAPAVPVAPGQSATAELQITDAGNFGSGCQQTATDGLRIYPPDQTAALFVAHNDFGCADTSDVTLQVGAFQK